MCRQSPIKNVITFSKDYDKNATAVGEFKRFLMGACDDVTLTLNERVTFKLQDITFKVPLYDHFIVLNIKFEESNYANNGIFEMFRVNCEMSYTVS